MFVNKLISVTRDVSGEFYDELSWEGMGMMAG